MTWKLLEGLNYLNLCAVPMDISVNSLKSIHLKIGNITCNNRLVFCWNCELGEIGAKMDTTCKQNILTSEVNIRFNESQPVFVVKGLNIGLNYVDQTPGKGNISVRKSL